MSPVATFFLCCFGPRRIAMADEPTVIDVPADDHYWSETLQQFVYSYRCPRCQVISVVTLLDDVTQCNCGQFVRVVQS